MTNDSCKNEIEETLKPLKGLHLLDIDVQQQKVLLELQQQSVSIHEIQSLIESKLGMTTVIKGIGENQAAVSEIKGFDNIIGVVRLTQLLNQRCLVDGVIDGLRKANNYSLKIHEYGDLSGDQFENVGNVYVPILNHLQANDSHHSSRASFKLEVGKCNLSECIGRSLAVSKDNKVVGAGIVARASSIGHNIKKICVCSGKTLWEERTKSLDDQAQTASRL